MEQPFRLDWARHDLAGFARASLDHRNPTSTAADQTAEPDWESKRPDAIVARRIASIPLPDNSRNGCVYRPIAVDYEKEGVVQKADVHGWVVNKWRGDRNIRYCIAPRASIPKDTVAETAKGIRPHQVLA